MSYVQLTHELRERLRSARLRMGWTGSTLAQASGLSPSTIQRLEAGQSKRVRRTTLLRISRALNLALDELQIDLGAEEPTQSPISLYFDLTDYSGTDIASLLSLLSSVYEELGGDRLVIDNAELYTAAEAPVPAEV